MTLIGGNGAGKTTTLRTISGLLRPRSGTVRFLGEDITQLPAHRIVARGIGHVPEGRMVFSNLTVEENLAMGAYLRTDKAAIAGSRDYVFGIFPRLRERLRQTAGTLSGGEQQMLAIGRALMGEPKFLMLDEPSLGIAPRLISTIFEKIVEINRDRKIAILLVEQNANLALEISAHAYVLETGQPHDGRTERGPEEEPPAEGGVPGRDRAARLTSRAPAGPQEGSASSPSRSSRRVNMATRARRVAGPPVPRAVPVELDAVPVRVAQVQGLAHAVVRGPVEGYARRWQAPERVGELRPAGVKDRQVVEAGRARRAAAVPPGSPRC